MNPFSHHGHYITYVICSQMRYTSSQLDIQLVIKASISDMRNKLFCKTSQHRNKILCRSGWNRVRIDGGG